MSKVTDDAILELLFNPESQGLSLDAISETIDSSVSPLDPTLLAQLKQMEEEAVANAEKNNTDAALSLLSECIRIEPTYASAYNNRAQVYRMMNKEDLALEDLNKVIEIAQDQPKVLRQAYTQRAILKRHQGDLQGSQQDFAKGARYGNPIARNILVQENPYAKMCNQVMMEVMRREIPSMSQQP
ncbi:hypothetical protein BDF14DRAFT_1789720 [Spinellus fusiger]|nr:hypothetical protein BDF14DRAFT_1789720 [Spinellus fusiger]